MSTTKSGNSGKETELNNENLVGSKIEVWWPQDRNFYPAVIDSYDPVSRKHKVAYVDGDQETLNLKRQKWKLAVREPLEKSDPVQAAVEQSSSPQTASLHEKKQSSDMDSAKVKHSIKETSQHMGDTPAQKKTDHAIPEKSQGNGLAASVLNSNNEHALSGEERTLLDNCVVALNKLKGIDGSKYAKFAKVLHNDAVWRQMFMLMPDHRKKDVVLHY
ncbi:hypothetical protein LIER_00044 [Lithospermum erythrorhizon]|uniref:Tudor domain-containing protein n=1 Tax=Lithospermum erythrorhizon TaxID=34254 RepID=A0AAV3NG51_LITER